MSHALPTQATALRHDWRAEEVRALHDLPLLELLHRAQTVHREVWGDHAVQLCSLLSIKTGGCPEDCAYCPQSARHRSPVAPEPLMEVRDVLDAARLARDRGATRFCMGAAWRQVRQGPAFDQVLEMVRGVRDLGMEACVTLGMLTADQARALADAGLTAYNHNLDTSESFYGEIVTTRTWADRLLTLEHVRDAGIQVCCGGILGMGESVDDRCELLRTLATLPAHPESVPINALVPSPGTPLADRGPVPPLDMVRVIATARLLMPRTKLRLSAGRLGMSDEAQVLCFLAGANSIFFGDTLLTTANPRFESDLALLRAIGAEPAPPQAPESRA